MGMKPRPGAGGSAPSDGPVTFEGLSTQPKRVEEFSNEGGDGLVTSLKTSMARELKGTEKPS